MVSERPWVRVSIGPRSFSLPVTYIVKILCFAGQNSAKYGGKKYLDIREHFPSDDDGEKLIPTKLGIRFSVDHMETLESLIRECVDKIDQLSEKSSRIFNVTKMRMLEADIRATRRLKNTCDGCRIDHPSQTKHTMDRSCEYNTPWCDIIDKYYEDAVKGRIIVLCALRVNTL